MMRVVMILAAAAAAAVAAAGFVNEESAAFIEKIKADANVNKDPSGMFYKVLVEGDASKPTATNENQIKFTYRAKLLDGTIFDGEDEKYGFPTQHFGALRNVLTMMPPGAKWEVYLPPDLAFGDSDKGKVPGGSVVTFTIDLHEVLPVPTGYMAVYYWLARNPLKVLLSVIGLKMLLDTIFGGSKPGGAQNPLEDLKNKESNPRVQIDFTVDGKPAGNVEAELFVSVVPKTVDLFKQISTGKGKKGKSGYNAVDREGLALGRLQFQSQAKIVKVAPKINLIGHPEYTKGYISHECQYLLSIANARMLDDEAPLEFFFTLGKADNFDGEHVVFGSVVSGQKTIDELEKLHQAGDSEIVITNCTFKEARKTE